MAKRWKIVSAARKRETKRMKLNDYSPDELMFRAYSDDLRHQID
jgi:hypothetical protein